MTTRRGFLKGMLACAVAVALPGGAEYIPDHVTEELVLIRAEQLFADRDYQGALEALRDRGLLVEMYYPDTIDGIRIRIRDGFRYASADISRLLLDSAYAPDDLIVGQLRILARQLEEMS